MSNAQAFAELATVIRKIREVPRLAEQAAPTIAERLQAKLQSDYAAQQNPDGTPWEPAQDGRTMFTSAAGALDVQARGTRVTARIQSRNLYRHHRGIARGAPQRLMMPTRDNAGGLQEIVEAAVQEAFEAHFG